MYIPIPEGLQIPQDGNTKPFKLSGMFIAMGNSLMPLQLEGKPVMMAKDEGEDSQHEAEEGPEYEASESEGEGECCSECGGSGVAKGMGKMGEMGSDKNKGNSFVIAIERSMKGK
jgi:hypothetical protein